MAIKLYGALMRMIVPVKFNDSNRIGADRQITWTRI